MEDLMPERLADFEGQGAEVLHTDTLARRPAGEEPEANVDQIVRERAHLLWEQAGRPHDRADEFWHEARCQISSEGADAMLQREGGFEGRADEHLHRDARLAKASKKKP
jgi:Protein of unknown function (DUF2934)